MRYSSFQNNHVVWTTIDADRSTIGLCIITDGPTGVHPSVLFIKGPSCSIIVRRIYSLFRTRMAMLRGSLQSSYFRDFRAYATGPSMIVVTEVSPKWT